MLWKRTIALWVAALISGASRVDAALISITTATSNSSSITATAISGNNGAGGVQTLNVTNSGTSATLVPGATVTASTDYIANIAADRDSAGSGTKASGTISVNYTDTFTVTPDIPTATYTLLINTMVLGALTGNNDSAASASSGTVSTTDIAGSLNGMPDPGLGLSVAASGSKPSSGTTSAQFTGSSSLPLGPFTGTQIFQLNFTFTLAASSTSGLLAGGPEEAVRLGGAGQLSFSTADDYPGVGSRTQANDGDFVTITATVATAPEPGTFVLAALAGCGFSLIAWRRRKAG
jgi:PEP-CTERM motif